MLYLEDYLEMIEHIPQELRDRFTDMREMDLQVHNAMDNLDEQVKTFFSNIKKMRPEQRDIEYERIKQEYYKTLEDAEEKVNLANQIYELVEKYLRRLDQEIQKFKIELEADNAGITQILERRSLELDNQPQVVNNVREKRKYTFHNTNMNSMPGAHSAHNNALRESNLSSPSCGFITSTNITNNKLNSNTFTPLSNIVSSGLSTTNTNTANGIPALPQNVARSLSNNSSAVLPPNSGAFSSPLTHSSLSYNLGAGNNAIAAAASQAIAATQQMQQGRRTASLKASYEAINAGLQNLCDFNALREPSVSGQSSVSHSNDLSHYNCDSTTKSSRSTKRNRVSGQFESDEPIETMTLDENGVSSEWPYDPNEPRYCLCNQVSYGDMVACDNEECQYEWFHYGCVSITQPPKGKWFCPPCTQLMKRKNRKQT